MLRIATIVLLVNVIGFKATAYAEVAAWLGALSMNFVAFEYNLRKEMKTEEAKQPVMKRYYYKLRRG